MLIFWIAATFMISLSLAFIAWPFVRAHKQLTKSVIVIMLCVPVMAIFLYNHWGAGNKAVAYQQRMAQIQKIREQLVGEKDPQQIIQHMQAFLAKHPEDAKAWYLLGRVYFTTQRFSEAKDAFANALKHHPDELDLQLQYAQALFFANDRNITSELRGFMDRILEKHPDNSTALNILAVNAFNHEQYQQALAIWQKLLPNYPVDSEDRHALEQVIAMAKSKLAHHSPQALGHIVSIKVSVAVDKALLNHVSPTDTVFIYAKAIQGPQMPLAVVRKQVKDLPVSITLDDSKAMSPMMRLSQHPKVMVIARISKSGNALPQAGDYSISSEPLDLAHRNNIAVNLHIS